jgi:hypothetical protein
MHGRRAIPLFHAMHDTTCRSYHHFRPLHDTNCVSRIIFRPTPLAPHAPI